MTAVIFAHELVGEAMICEGQTRGYVKRYDPDAYGGRGWVDFTDEIADALRFRTKAEAIAFIRQVPRNRPLRPDGLANRPLMAFTLEVIGGQFGGGPTPGEAAP